ncbi:hypothetical protein Pla110_26540 [Polystyrenella longa]|uniref:4Fe-4S ferredoxin-type domain-containing protein n=1 Tax=Polystyrenella longa TaxID=2528007 RepID=A0A518CNX7_9PLAN|nr:hypothetical protein [Polystyrenella longa]QDU80918.1 hypothetical protein Pla110_26540 [Polystyrenella longa]
MKKLVALTLVATLLAVGSQYGNAKSKQTSQIPAEVGFFYVPGKMQVVSHLEEARLQKEKPELLEVAFQAPLEAPPVEPLTIYPEQPTSVYSEQVVSSTPMQLYHRVEVEDRHNIHPCAVTKIVSVLDPCPPTCCATNCGSCDSCNNSCGSCCPQGCVFVQICVPPYGCPEVKISRHGSKVKYDYGSYEVELTSRNGVVEVDYDD